MFPEALLFRAFGRDFVILSRAATSPLPSKRLRSPACRAPASGGDQPPRPARGYYYIDKLENLEILCDMECPL